MFRHVALFTWTAEAAEEQKQVVRDALAALPGLVPGLLDYRFGDDARVSDGNHDFAVVADFADVAGYLGYRDHPAHIRVLTDLVRPIAASRAAVQFEAG